MLYDYIIVGAGTAGCILANRLSSDPANKVLLIEAGPEDKELSLKIPAAMLTNLKNTKHNWSFQGEPEPELNNRQIQHDRGKTLGGSSSINGMVYIRGHAMDFQHWRESGCEGWGYADVLPYFKRAETYGDGDTFHGDSGPMKIFRPEPENPIYKAFIKAGKEAGYPVTDDINGYCQEGFGVLDRSVHEGQRWSTARAYLDPARNRPNLSIMTEAQVENISFENNKATGVVTKDHQGKLQSVQANKEVILSAGAVGTPKLLMLSGIGPKDHLQAMNIAIRADLPGVGQNLNDHPDFVLKYKCLQPVSLWPKTKRLPSLAAGLQWLLTRKGMCASNHFEVVACIRSAAGVEYPDIQLTISPIAVDDETWSPLPEHAFQIHVGLMRAYSRGHVQLRDADPSSGPRILVNYLQDKRDRDMMHAGIRHVRELVEQPAFAPLRGAEIYPGSKVQNEDEMNIDLNNSTTTQWHLSGTAKMGPKTDPQAVVDSHGRVYGIDSLRV
ncbi:MAG: choline dehydrogenase, partial [Gammaproteobacteria bacterium]